MPQTEAGKLAGQSLDGFQLESLLGIGGMAEVYRGRDVKLGRAVAIKVLHPAFAADEGYVERFRNEARRVAALNHPHIVPVYQYGEASGYLYLVMPLLEESLRDRLDRERPLPIADAARLIVQIASALDVAHSKGLVHRDVKPENILLNAESKALLTDFGIARELSMLSRGNGNLTLAATGLPIGTPEYMAPEQLRNEAIDQRVDVYALGAVFYEMLTGVAPHEAGTPYEVAVLALTTPIVLPSRRNADVSPELEQVMLTALANESAHRYASVRDFARALRAVVLSSDERTWRPTMAGSRVTMAIRPERGLPELPDSPEPLPHGGGVALAIHPEAAMKSGPLSWELPARPQPRGKRRRVLVATCVALVVALSLAGGTVLLLNSSLAGSGGALGVGKGVLSGLPGIGSNPTATTGDNATPGATTSPTALPTPTPSSQPTATATPAVTPSVSISPMTWQLHSHNGICTGSSSSGGTTQTIINSGPHAITWTWQSANSQLQNSLYYNLNNTGWTQRSGVPSNIRLSAGGQDTLDVGLLCPKKSQTYQVSVVASDNVTGTQTSVPVTLVVPSGG